MPPIWSWAQDRRIFLKDPCVLHLNPARVRLAAYLGIKRKTAGSRAGRFQRSSWREPQ